MEADFSGYATKAGLKCSDGRTIMPNAFQQQDKVKVPLVWQHGHKDPENVLGHVLLENRNDGVYAYGFFNSTPKAKHAHTLLEHKDINMMSIWANDLIERAGRVLHGAIREVSLVLSGANPGALIENVTIRHGDVDEELEDEAIIFTGLPLELKHSDQGTGGDRDSGQTSAEGDTHNADEPEEEDTTVQDVIDSMTEEQKQVVHSLVGKALQHDDSTETEPKEVLVNKTHQEIYDSMTEEQQQVMHSLLAEALQHQDGSGDGSGDGDKTIQDVYDSMSEEQQQVCHYLIGEALEQAASGSLEQSNVDDNNNDQKGKEMKHNVFESTGEESNSPVLTHDDMKEIIESAKKGGSLKDAVEEYALSHGIENIDRLFPEVQAITNTPEFLTRRVEWVQAFLDGVSKSPFSRIKTITADLTYEEARAKGYITGNLKKEEFFPIARRVTTPTTVYKKQSIDRDDVVDITDFDVVAWLKGEMRLMLDEELARAALMGDGRDISDEDKINEQNIRPIAKESEVFATTVTVNLDDTNSSITEVVDAVITNRRFYRGTGTPTLFMAETFISKFLLLRDTLGRRIYQTVDDVASELRVQSIVPVMAMEDEPDLVGIIVNPADYVFGATAGGQVSLFDFFDIDYNKQKYLIETRVSGALTKMKSAIIIRKTASGSDTLVTPTAPTFDPDTNEITITDTTGVVYKNADTGDVLTNTGSPYTVSAGTSVTVVASATSGHYLGTTAGNSWTFSATS